MEEWNFKLTECPLSGSPPFDHLNDGSDCIYCQKFNELDEKDINWQTLIRLIDDDKEPISFPVSIENHEKLEELYRYALHAIILIDKKKQQN